MPIYEYKCRECGEVFESLQSGSADNPECVTCGSQKTSKIFSSFSVGASRNPDEECGACDMVSQGCPGGNCGL